MRNGIQSSLDKTLTPAMFADLAASYVKSQGLEPLGLNQQGQLCLTIDDRMETWVFLPQGSPFPCASAEMPTQAYAEPATLMWLLGLNGDLEACRGGCFSYSAEDGVLLYSASLPLLNDPRAWFNEAMRIFLGNALYFEAQIDTRLSSAERAVHAIN